MGPTIDSKPVSSSNGVNPDKIMLSNQFLQRHTVRLANLVRIGCHVRWIELVSKPLKKAFEGSARRDRQRAYYPADFEFAPSSMDRLFVFLLGWNNHERYVSKAAQQPPNIQYALLGPVGLRQRPVGGNK
jgi:hypothetical protein